MSWKGSPLTGKRAQKREGKLSKFENVKLNDRTNLSKIFQGISSLVTNIESISYDGVAGK